MIRNNTNFTTDKSAQAYTLEAVIAVLILFGVILFIAPSFAIPGDNESIEKAEQNEEVIQEIEAALEKHAANGELKATILDSNSNNPGADFRFRLMDLENNVYDEFFLYAYAVPDSAEGAAEPKRIELHGDDTSIHNVAVVSTTITLYENDNIGYHPEMHSRHGTAKPQYDSSGTTVAEADYPDEFPIPPGTHDQEDGTVYNTVTVYVVIDRVEI